jgi:hypothetical protein
MRKIYSLFISLNLLFLLAGCKSTTVEDPKPVYKFTAKINNVDWSTYQTTTSATTYYISDCQYYTGGNTLYITVINPVTTESFNASLYIANPQTAVATYPLSGSKYSDYAFYTVNDNDNPNSYGKGTFTITKFTIDSKTFKLSNLSAKFEFTQTAQHSDGKIRTTTVSSGEMNDVPNI